MHDKKYPASEAFYGQYSGLCDRRVCVFLKDGLTSEGIFCNEFFEDYKIADIDRMESAEIS